jgi:hypothetical protein
MASRPGPYGHCQPFSHNQIPNPNATTTMMAQANSERLSVFILRSPIGSAWQVEPRSLAPRPRALPSEYVSGSLGIPRGGVKLGGPKVRRRPLWQRSPHAQTSTRQAFCRSSAKFRRPARGRCGRSRTRSTLAASLGPAAAVGSQRQSATSSRELAGEAAFHT